MFCYQCEQTAKGEGCTKLGVCGKPADVAALQDLLVYALRGLAVYAMEGRRVGVGNDEVNSFTCEALFSTLTNVNFDPERFVHLIHHTVELREQLKNEVSYYFTPLEVATLDALRELYSNRGVSSTQT